MTKHWNTIAVVASIIGVVVVMLAGMAFQINSTKIANEAASVQGPVSDFYKAEDALRTGTYDEAILFADKVLAALAYQDGAIHVLLHYDVLVLKGRAQIAAGEALAAKHTLALACAYKSAWGPAYYYRGVAHFILGDHLAARKDFDLALANGLPDELRLQATESLNIIQEDIATK